MEIDKNQLKKIFAKHPTAEALTVTADGNVFFEKNDAENYSQSAKLNEKPVTVKKKDLDKSTDEKTETGKDEKPKIATEPKDKPKDESKNKKTQTDKK